MNTDRSGRSVRPGHGERQGRLLQIIRDHVDEFDPRRVDETLAPYADDVCLVEENDFKPDPRTYQGRKRCRDYWKSWIRVWEASDWSLEDIRAAGDRVAVVLRYWARGSVSHAEVTGRIGMVYTFAPRTELIVRHQLFGDPDAAVAALDRPVQLSDRRG